MAGGDWFDAIPLADGGVALVVGDVVGHGVVASAAMGQLHAVLGDALATRCPPAEALANRCRTEGSHEGATCGR